MHMAVVTKSERDGNLQKSAGGYRGRSVSGMREGGQGKEKGKTSDKKKWRGQVRRRDVNGRR